MQFQARMGHIIAPETYDLMRYLVEEKREDKKGISKGKQ